MGPFTKEELYEVLIKFKLFYEVIPYKGMIDHEMMEITINPAFWHDQSEILMHEILHFNNPSATEWYVRERAKELVKNDEIKNYLDSYCNNHAYIKKGSNIFSQTGYKKEDKCS